jgi:hypothetical protein
MLGTLITICLENTSSVKIGQISGTLHEDQSMFYIVDRGICTSIIQKRELTFPLPYLIFPWFCCVSFSGTVAQLIICIQESKAVKVPQCYIRNTLSILFNYIYLQILKNRYIIWIPSAGSKYCLQKLAVAIYNC